MFRCSSPMLSEASPTPRFTASKRASPLFWIRSESTECGTAFLLRSLSTRIWESVTELMSSPVSLSTTRTSSPSSTSSAIPFSVM